MSNYNTTLQSNNTDLQTILNSINELPNAGGSGGSVETCTVKISTSFGVFNNIAYSHLVNGEITSEYLDNRSNSYTFSNVICGSFLYIAHSETQISPKQMTGMELLSTTLALFRITAEAGETAILELYNPF